MTRRAPALFPALLRHWRTRRGMSQLDLALAAEVSARHVSFLETGRSRPSREMILRLSSTLDVPLREQNAMFRAAGLEEVFPDPAPDAPFPPAVERAIDRMMAQHEPFPLVVFDRKYDIVRLNGGASRLLPIFVADSGALEPPVNAMALLFDPRGARPFIEDWPQAARSMLARLHREVLASGGDAELGALLHRILELPDVPASWKQPDFGIPSEPTLTVRLRRDDTRVAFLTTVTTFSAPQNVALEELHLESWFPLDDQTAEVCGRLARG
ncbi:MAG TPA: helix-turn-helix transcriptional regulator [Myxococcaceae bacterium]|nr:helix-turn-helix transcriptional regulator [Myxococcaceae bacterium]